MSDLPALLTAGAGLLTVLGAAAAFIWNKLEARFLAIERELAKCHAREGLSGQRRAHHMLAVELLLQEVERLSPSKSRVIGRVKRVLEEIDRLDRVERETED